MSNRPGLGAESMKSLADTLKASSVRELPSQVRINGKLRPIGRYLMKVLAKEMDMEEEWKEKRIRWLNETSIEMRDLLAAEIASAPLAPTTSKSAYISSKAGAIEKAEGRERIFGNRRKL